MNRFHLARRALCLVFLLTVSIGIAGALETGISPRGSIGFDTAWPSTLVEMDNPDVGVGVVGGSAMYTRPSVGVAVDLMLDRVADTRAPAVGFRLSTDIIYSKSKYTQTGIMIDSDTPENSGVDDVDFTETRLSVEVAAAVKIFPVETFYFGLGGGVAIPVYAEATWKQNAGEIDAIDLEEDVEIETGAFLLGFIGSDFPISESLSFFVEGFGRSYLPYESEINFNVDGMDVVMKNKYTSVLGFGVNMGVTFKL
ncbi:MAG: hypothetical protein ACLFPV_06955 [Spirochaetaceae bacterium]